jgi:N-acetylmuramoyl-L-alanine amidase
MPDETNPPPENTDNNPDIPPSTLFLEMMRRAAARRVPTPDDRPVPPEPVSPSQSSPPADTATAADRTDDTHTTDDSDDTDGTDDTDNNGDDVRTGDSTAPDDSPADTAQSSATSPARSGRNRPRRLRGTPYLPPLTPDGRPDTSGSERSRAASNAADVPSVPPAQPIPHTDSPSGTPQTTTRRQSAARARVPVYEAPVLSDEERASRLEEQRVRRVRRRQQRRRKRRAGMLGGFLRTIFIVIFAAGLASTIFTWFTRPDFIRQDVAGSLQSAAATQTPASVAAAPTALPTPNWMRRIGIVAGHHGPENDPGAICPDGLTEVEINFAVAQKVGQLLRQRGYRVDLLDEFDPRLDNYQAAALVSIHSNTCQDFGEYVSGFLVSKAAARPEGGVDTMLAECIADYYGEATSLERRLTLTLDMTDYHTFREIHPLTPAAILELGFMKDDRDLLVNQQDRLAQGIVDGVECFLLLESSPGRPAAPGSDSAPSPAMRPSAATN